MTALIEARGIEMVYGNSLRALDDVSLSVPAGEFHGLIGPNGSGKSTLMKCLAGAETPTRGSVHLDGRRMDAWPPSERARAGLSLKFQITSVIPSLTLYDNILLALQGRDPLWSLIGSGASAERHQRAARLLDQFLLSSRADEAAGTLSHGQQQWLEIAMALASDPRVLLLDEPTAGMSVEERRLTGELLRPLKSRCALVIVEHDLDFIRGLCDRITVLDQGRVLDSGTVAHIQASEKVREVYVRRH